MSLIYCEINLLLTCYGDYIMAYSATIKSRKTVAFAITDTKLYVSLVFCQKQQHQREQRQQQKQQKQNQTFYRNWIQDLQKQSTWTNTYHGMKNNI